MSDLAAETSGKRSPGVLVDTSVWSLALRRKSSDLNSAEKNITEELAYIVGRGGVGLLGVVRQEVLSGIREEVVFNRICDYLRSFDDPRPEISDYEEAAQMSNRCRSRGVAGSPIDFLICAVAHRRSLKVFTLDRDFDRYARVLGVQLYSAL